MSKTAVIACAAALSFAGVASAEVAYWSFNNAPLPGGGFGYMPTDLPIAANFGAQAGTATVNVFGGITSETRVTAGGDTVLTWVESFAGSTVNAQFGEASGGSLSVEGGTDTLNNGAFIEIAFNASGVTNTAFSFAGRRTSSGFSDVDILAYDGATLLGSLQDDLNLTTSSTLELISINAGLLDGVADARIRLVLNGATGSGGNVRLDNFLVVPTPGTAALMGLGGLVAARRRRA